MKLKDIEKNKVYEIINFGNIENKKILEFYDQGVLEGEKIKKKEDIKLNSKINLYLVDDNVFSINIDYIKEIEVEETNE